MGGSVPAPGGPGSAGPLRLFRRGEAPDGLLDDPVADREPRAAQQGRVRVQGEPGLRQRAALQQQGLRRVLPFYFILTASHIMASELQSLFAKEMETITGQIFAAGPDAQAPTYYVPSRRERAPLPDIPPKLPRVSESRPAKSSAEKARLAQKEEMEMMKSRIQQLEGELSRMTQEVNERQGKGEKALDARPMTMEEKKALSMEINQLKGSDLEEVVRIVWGQMAGEQMQQNDIELDLSAMPNETLRKLERYIVQCKEAKKAPKRQRKAHLHTPREKTFDFDDNQFVDDFEDSCRREEGLRCSGLRAGGVLGIVSYRILLVLSSVFVRNRLALLWS